MSAHMFEYNRGFVSEEKGFHSGFYVLDKKMSPHEGVWTKYIEMGLDAASELNIDFFKWIN